MQFEIGDWMFGFFWRDWILAVLPAIKRERNIWRDGICVCIGPFRIVKYPAAPETPIR